MKAYLKNYRQSPRKVRLVADVIRGKQVSRALSILSFIPKRAAEPLKKLLLSAVANARNGGVQDPETLIVGKIHVDEGIVFKRIEYRARGAANLLKKRTSHISIVLEEQSENQKVNSKKQNDNAKIKDEEAAVQGQF